MEGRVNKDAEITETVSVKEAVRSLGAVLVRAVIEINSTYWTTVSCAALQRRSTASMLELSAQRAEAC